MRAFTFVAGVVCLFAVLLDAFQTIILPRRATGRFRLTRIFYVLTWTPWVFIGKPRHRPGPPDWRPTGKATPGGPLMRSPPLGARRASSGPGRRRLR